MAILFGSGVAPAAKVNPGSGLHNANDAGPIVIQQIGANDPFLELQRNDGTVLAQIAADGSLTAAGGTVSGNEVVTGTLAVTGATTLTGAAALNGGGSIGDGANIALGTTTGTQIGTATGQKLGFWGHAPVVQQVLATGAAHTVDDVITFLQAVGLCKQA